MHAIALQRGLTPRVFDYLFEKIKQEEGNSEQEVVHYNCCISFLEIYNGGWRRCSPNSHTDRTSAKDQISFTQLSKMGLLDLINDS